jgi:hypothetical protein
MAGFDEGLPSLQFSDNMGYFFSRLRREFGLLRDCPHAILENLNKFRI